MNNVDIAVQLPERLSCIARGPTQLKDTSSRRKRLLARAALTRAATPACTILQNQYAITLARIALPGLCQAAGLSQTAEHLLILKKTFEQSTKECLSMLINQPCL